MAELAIASAVISSFAKIKQGQATAALYKSQAMDAEFRGESQRLSYLQEANKYRQQGLVTLEKMKSNAATVNARAGSASIDPYSGSTGALQTTNLKNGFYDYTISLESAANETDNSVLAIERAKRQAAELRSAAKQAKSAAFFSAAVGLASAGATYGGIGGPSGGFSSQGGGGLYGAGVP